MNRCIFVGRLVNDPEVRWTTGQNQMAVARYRMAVERKYKKDGEPTADFISCVAFGKNGEFAERYLHKGMKIAIEAHFQSGSYTNNDGQKVYTADFVVDSHEFCESKNAGQTNSVPSMPANDGIPDGFSSIEDDDIPF